MNNAAAGDIQDYIAGLREDVRDIAEAVRKTIRAELPDAEEKVRYGIPAFVLGGRTIVYFAVWKTHIGLYPIYRGTDDFEKALAPFRAKKDTVRFPLKKPIPLELISRIVASQMAAASRQSAT